MKNFNLIISTGRDFEIQAECELWFNLLAIGDSEPEISQSKNPGLVLAKTKANTRELVYYMRKILENGNTNYIQFIQKIIPIDVVCESELEIIGKQVKKLYQNSEWSKKPNSKFRISVRKRNTDYKTREIIDEIAPLIPHEVSLQNFDWNLQLEIFGGITGIAILNPNDIFRPISEKRELLN